MIYEYIYPLTFEYLENNVIQHYIYALSLICNRIWAEHKQTLNYLE